MQKFKFYLLYYGLGLLSLLPWWALYFFSDILYLAVRLSGYRADVIMDNLRYSFPEKSEVELKRIRRKFYHHFCDLFVETVKLQTVSEKAIGKHIKFENTEYADKIFEQGRCMLAAIGHYGNWEWIIAVNYVIKHREAAIYKPLKSKLFDKYMYAVRTSTGGLVFPMKTVFRDLLKLKRDGIKYAIGVIADQSPLKSQIQHYSCFLNQKTPVHMGLEKMAVKFDDVVVYLRMEKIKRGHYKATFVPLFESPKETKEFEITDTAMKYLEEDIKRKPEYWLWSHRRWKHVEDKDRPCNVTGKTIGDEQG